MINRRPILVTGSHRSGSTWVGQIIATGPRIKYISEPFNINIKRQDQPFNLWFEYVSDESNHDKERIKRYIKNLYSFKLKTPFEKLNQGIYSYLKNIQTKLFFRPLLKDPIAFFSAEWIFKTFKADVLVIIRHPAAFVASLKVKNWEFGFKNLLNQDHLMKTLLGEYKNQIEEYAVNKPDIIEQGVLLWNIIYSVALKYQQNYDQKWYFVTHEDLSLNPESEFEKIFNYFNIKFTNKVKSRIVATSKAELKKANEVERNSKQNITTWKNRLTHEEIDYIKENTKNIWQEFYGEEDW